MKIVLRVFCDLDWDCFRNGEHVDHPNLFIVEADHDLMSHIKRLSNALDDLNVERIEMDMKMGNYYHFHCDGDIEMMSDEEINELDKTPGVKGDSLDEQRLYVQRHGNFKSFGFKSRYLGEDGTTSVESLWTPVEIEGSPEIVAVLA